MQNVHQHRPLHILQIKFAYLCAHRVYVSVYFMHYYNAHFVHITPLSSFCMNL